MKCRDCSISMQRTSEDRLACPSCGRSVKTWDAGYQPFTPVRDAGTLAGAAAEAGWRQ